jgi:hypothetical protein
VTDDYDPIADLDETHKLLIKQAEGEIINLPIQSTGHLNLAGDGAEAHKRRIAAGRMTGAMNITQGVNVEEAEDLTFQGVVLNHGIQEDGSVISIKNIGGVVTSRIEVAPSVEDENPEFSIPQLTEPELSFTPFLWVGLKYLGGGTLKFPEYHSVNTKGRQAFAHLAVWEPASPDKDDGADDGDTHNIVSNRDQLLADDRVAYPLPSKPDFFFVRTLHGKADADVFDSKNPAYPLGPNKSKTLEAWQNPDYKSMTGKESDNKAFETVIRSKRHDENETDVFSRSGVGSVHARTGDYYIKLYLYAGNYTDWMNLTPTKFELEVWVGRGTGEVLIRKYEIEHQQHSGYLMGALPKGWYPKINNFFPSAALPCNACATNIADYGTNAHGGAWWPKGVRVTMPPDQQGTPVSLFAKPEAWKPFDDLIPPVGFGSAIPKISKDAGGANVGEAVPPIKLGVWPDRIWRAGDCNSTRTTYRRISIQIVLAQIAFSGAQVFVRSDVCPDVTEPPEVIAWSNVFEGDTNQKKMFGHGIYAGTYWTQDGLNRVILHPGDDNNGNHQIWQEGSCFAAAMDVIRTTQIPWSDELQALIDTELNPLLRVVTMYLRTTSSATGTSGEDYGPGQRPTIWDGTSITEVSNEAEFSAAGGPGGLFSVEFTPDLTCSRIMESF